MNSDILQLENLSNATIIIKNHLASNSNKSDLMIEWFSKRVWNILLIHDNLCIWTKNLSEYDYVSGKVYKDICFNFIYLSEYIKAIQLNNHDALELNSFNINYILDFFNKKCFQDIRKINTLWEMPNDIIESINDMKYILSIISTEDY